MNRRQLRSDFRKRRGSLPTALHQQHGVAALSHLQNSGLLRSAHHVGLYVSADGELDTQPLIDHLLEQQIRIALPAITDRSESQMVFRAHDRKRALVPGAFGILAPTAAAPEVAVTTLDLMLLPMVAFDGAGTRLGMGGGYFDRLLGALDPPQRPLLVGVAHSIQYSEAPLPKAAWDIPVDAVLTETALRPCSPRGRSLA